MSTYTSGTPQISSVFGRILSAAQIEDSAIATLKYWFPTYLAEQERQNGMRLGTLPAPTNYINRNSFDTLEGEPLPKVVVISEGLANAPTKTGRGVYRALWRLGVGVATAAKDEQMANAMVKGYGAAVRGIITQNQALDASLSIAEITWVDERYDDLPIANQIMLFKAAQLYFTVDVEDVVSRWKGPDSPTAQPVDYGQVEEVFVELDKVDEGGDING